MKFGLLACAVALALSTTARAADNVVTYHNSNDRRGDYIVPGLTFANAGNMHMNTSFNGVVSGQVYAQPLFWNASTGGEVIVATETNIVYALNAASGSVVWQTQLGSEVKAKQLPCGDIDPVGITGTPVIDPTAGVVYLDAYTITNGSVRHLLYALSLTDGSILSGWPLDVEASLKGLGANFSSLYQGQRSALLLFDGSVYVSYGGHYGDCGSYHGWVVQVDPATPAIVAYWATQADRGGIWSQGGVGSDGTDLYATTGNTRNTTTWGDGEGIIRLTTELTFSGNPEDYFAPANWGEMDKNDKDLGGTEALPFDIPGVYVPPAQRMLALGKDGNAYLLDRVTLGGIGGQLAQLSVSNLPIRTGPAVYSASSSTMVAFMNLGSAQCQGHNITMLGITASRSSPVSVLWCTQFTGTGSPIITTIDGTTDPIVWVASAQGELDAGDKLLPSFNSVLHGFNAITGQSVYTGKEKMSGLQYFGTILAADGNFYIAGDGRIYAFTF